MLNFGGIRRQTLLCLYLKYCQKIDPHYQQVFLSIHCNLLFYYTGRQTVTFL